VHQQTDGGFLDQKHCGYEEVVVVVVVVVVEEKEGNLLRSLQQYS